MRHSHLKPSLVWWFMLLSFVAVFLWLPAQTSAASQRVYEFKVFLDDDQIGNQRFVVSSDGKRTQVQVEAAFDVTFWFFTAYTYRHTNSETWEGDCLRAIRAQTNDNGESFFVQGGYLDGQMQLRTHNGQQRVRGCVKTFAYWNPAWFQSDRLLNSQTGELQPVEIQMVGEETVLVRGVPMRTEHQRIVSKKFTIDLWYSKAREWVALRSTTEKGGILRYELQ